VSKSKPSEFENEIERARLEIAALQKRIHEGVVRRKKPSEGSDGRKGRENFALKNDPRILEIDSEIKKAHEQIKKYPNQSKAFQIRIGALETERYRLLLEDEED
jgi:hypothetical protein